MYAFVGSPSYYIESVGIMVKGVILAPFPTGENLAGDVDRRALAGNA
jgi:hypothetical protein